MRRHDCFVTPVWQFPHEPSIDLASLEAVVEGQRVADQQGAKISNVGGWQSMMYLFRKAEFVPLRDFIAQKISMCCQDWGLDFRGYSPIVNTMWANVNMSGHVNLMHHHWGFPLTNFNVLSGAYYVRCNPASGAIRFMDERPSAKFIDLSPFMRSQNQFIGERYRIQPAPGDLVVFPAWLDHEVTPSSDDQPRISISFNVCLPRELTDRIYESKRPATS